jgi:hypothetical protein
MSFGHLESFGGPPRIRNPWIYSASNVESPAGESDPNFPREEQVGDSVSILDRPCPELLHTPGIGSREVVDELEFLVKIDDVLGRSGAQGTGAQPDNGGFQNRSSSAHTRFGSQLRF